MMSLNNSGLQPVEYKILVKPDELSDTDPVLKKAKETGIILAPLEDREVASQVKGRLIAKGSRAFYDFGDIRPELGDGLMFSRYAGQIVMGDDGQEYRLMNDKDVAAILLQVESHPAE